MLALLFYYIALPFLAAWLVMKFIRKYGASPIPEEVARLYAEAPLEKGWYRVIQRGPAGQRLLGDFEKHDAAVEKAYKERELAQVTGEKAAFLVLNDKGEALEEVDS